MPSTKFVFFEPIGKTRWPSWPLIGWDIFDFFSETAEQNSTKLGRKQDLNALYQVCVFQADRKNQDGRPGLWLAETFLTSLVKPLNRIQRNLIGRKITRPSTKFVFFGPIGKTRWPPWPLIGWDIFDFSSETAERNSTKLDRKQDLKALYQVCVFQADRKKQDGRPGLWLAETFSTSPLKPLNRFQQNLIGSKISKPSTKFVFFGPIGKTRWLPRPLIGWDIFHFSVETAERNSTNLDRKQDLNALYKVCVFRANRKNKMAAWPLIGWDIFYFFSETQGMEFNETYQESRSKCPLPSLCISGWTEKQDGRPGLWLAETFSTSPLKPLNWIQWNLIGSKISTPSTKFVFFWVDWKNKMAALASD